MLSLAPCAFPTFSTALALALIALTRVAVVAAAFDMSRNDNVRPSGLLSLAVRCLSSFCSVLMLMLMLISCTHVMSVHFPRWS